MVTPASISAAPTGGTSADPAPSITRSVPAVIAPALVSALLAAWAPYQIRSSRRRALHAWKAKRALNPIPSGVVSRVAHRDGPASSTPPRVLARPLSRPSHVAPAS